MIDRGTSNVLNLKPVTRSMCSGFYQRINTELRSPEAIRESVSGWQDNEKKLNELWWILNYYSDSLDPERELRACVEHHLDSLALEKTAALEPDSPPETSAALEQS